MKIGEDDAPPSSIKSSIIRRSGAWGAMLAGRLFMDASPHHTRTALSHEEARAFWYGLINYEQRTPTPDDLKLDRMKALLARLGNPQNRLRIVHIAGTKGKGSTAALLASVLRRAGYRTGLFTSPHLCRVEERFQVDGRPITADELTALLNDVYRAVEGAPHPAITFFEAATAVGFLHFVRRRVDAAVVEVGLGGRFDSTNVCRPAVAVITSISLDHTKQLGDRVAAIAMEKAGIVKPGRPTLSGATAAEARPVIERICRKRGSPLRQLGVDFRYDYEPGRVGFEEDRRPRSARHDAAASLAVDGTEPAGRTPGGQRRPGRGLRRAVTRRRAGRSRTRPCRPAWPAPSGRRGWRCSAGGRWWCSTAPQPRVGRSPGADAAGVVPAGAPAAGLRRQQRQGPGRHVPHPRPALRPRLPDAVPRQRRSAPPEQLAELLRAAGGPPATLHPSPAAAWEAARGMAGPDDLICITGSVFLAGETRPLLTAEGTKAES